jgi:hypothetical protein
VALSEKDVMNDILRSGGGKSLPLDVDLEPAIDRSFSGSREFTVQEPGVDAPDDQFVYEPMVGTPGAWAVYPPGVPCETEQYRISRATPAGVTDFPKMQQALDDAGGREITAELALPMDEMMEDEAGGY